MEITCELRKREQSTIEKYLRNIRIFAAWLDDTPVTKSAVIAWKEHLLTVQYAPATVNAALTSVNAFFKFAGWEECRVKALRLQRRVFRDPNRELTRDEYDHRVSTAYERGKIRTIMLPGKLCRKLLKHYLFQAGSNGVVFIGLSGYDIYAVC